MKTLKVKYLSHQVEVFLENGILSRLGDYLQDDVRYFIITDLNVAHLYLDSVTKQLKKYDLYLLSSGEKSKNCGEVENIINRMLEADIQKYDFIISLGGGVVGDIAGFVAAIYKRGIRFVSIPTTLMAQVDSSLGGKCGIDFTANHQNYKNQIGTVYHPETIFVDPMILKTLPKAEYLSGMAEVVKYGLCFSKKLFEQLFETFDLEEVIFQCLSIKAKITEKDEFDENLRLTLNFGHTVGHGLESFSQFSLSHGKAVAIGMLWETRQPEIKTRLRDLYQKLGIDAAFDFSMKDLTDFISKDKKMENENIRIPVFRTVGLIEMETKTLDAFLREIA